MENALKLMGRKFDKMRKRLEDALDELKKVDKAGKEMDGNCSNTEEDEFINALKEEMPEVFKNIEANFKQIDIGEKMIDETRASDDEAKLKALREFLDKESKKIQETEVLLDKLISELVEWNSHRKLIKRDEELESLEVQIADGINEFENEKQNMEAKIPLN